LEECALALVSTKIKNTEFVDKILLFLYHNEKEHVNKNKNKEKINTNQHHGIIPFRPVAPNTWKICNRDI